MHIANAQTWKAVKKNVKPSAWARITCQRTMRIYFIVIAFIVYYYYFMFSVLFAYLGVGMGTSRTYVLNNDGAYATTEVKKKNCIKYLLCIILKRRRWLVGSLARCRRCRRSRAQHRHHCKPSNPYVRLCVVCMCMFIDAQFLRSAFPPVLMSKSPKCRVNHHHAPSHTHTVT